MLNQRDWYGYEISEFLSGHIDISDGTVYPILRKLKAEGLVSTYLQEESGGPPRKYYCLTPPGKKAYLADKADYLEFAKTVDSLLKDDEKR
ncbi:MAG: PadR family transcriptional regulator [Anaerolineaceae bacterium]|nr:PadR family transcriptional regulator [Anaerolineaceae bacterium]